MDMEKNNINKLTFRAFQSLYEEKLNTTIKECATDIIKVNYKNEKPYRMTIIQILNQTTEPS